MKQIVFASHIGLALLAACAGNVEQQPAMEPNTPAGATAPSAHKIAPGETFAVIAEGEGPDDGGGYNLLIGVAAAPGTGHLEGIGRGRSSTVPGPCRFEVSSALVIEIEDRAELHHGTPIDLPHHSSDPNKADWLNAMHRCNPGNPCAAVIAGSLRIEALVPGKGAKGTYQFQTADSPLSGSFNAAWCGPTTPARSDVPQGAGSSASSAEWSTCQADRDCTLIEVGCCDRCNGGSVLTVNAKHAAEATLRYKQTSCSGECTERGCPPYEAICRNNVCGYKANGKEVIKPLP